MFVGGDGLPRSPEETAPNPGTYLMASEHDRLAFQDAAAPNLVKIFRRSPCENYLHKSIY